MRFSGVFLFCSVCSLLRKYDALYPIFDGLTIGENPFWNDEWDKKVGKIILSFEPNEVRL